MAVYNAPQFVDGSVDQKRLLPYEEHGKARANYAFYKNLTGGALVAGDQINLFKLPPGNVRLVPYLSMLRNTAAGAGTLNLGLRAYTQSSVDGASDIAEAPTELVNAKAITGAGAAAISTLIKYDLFSKRGIIVFATVNGVALPSNAEIELMLPYLYE